MPAAPALVVIPTYNEAESLPVTLRALFAATPGVHALVVDDASPDGTGELADSIAAADPRVHVLHRTAKDGLGAAYRAGFAWALERGHATVVQMDADGSHPASALPAMLARLEADPRLGTVIGSRWVPGGSVVSWPARRRILSVAANRYARWALRIPVADITAGYRAHRRELLEQLAGADIHSRGYCFQIDMTIRAHDLGWGIAEVPIAFTERAAGVSKMSLSIVAEAMARVTGWGLSRLVTGRNRQRSGPEVGGSAQRSASDTAR